MPWAYLLLTHGLGSVRPNIMKVRYANFYPFSCPLHPMVGHAWVDGPIGWRFNILWGWRFKVFEVDSLRFLELTVEGSWSWRFKVLEIDGWRFLELTDLQEDDMNSDHLLTGCQAFMRYDTCHFLIGFCPESKRRFIFRTFHIYITLLLPHFSTFQLKHIVKVPSLTLSESVSSNIYTHHLYKRRPSVTQTWWVLLLLLLLFTSLAFVLSFC